MILEEDIHMESDDLLDLGSDIPENLKLILDGKFVFVAFQPKRYLWVEGGELMTSEERPTVI